MSKLSDDSKMPFGKYKGTAMQDVPARYLLFQLDNGLKKGNVRDYILDNLDGLNEEDKEHRDD